MDGFLLLAFLFLAAGVIAVPIASRLGLGSVLGYLIVIAGIAISPILESLHVEVVSIQHFAEFGVVMMLFLAGLELKPRMLWEMRNRLLGLGGLQVLLTTALIMTIAMAMGQAGPLRWRSDSFFHCRRRRGRSRAFTGSWHVSRRCGTRKQRVPS